MIPTPLPDEPPLDAVGEIKSIVHEVIQKVWAPTPPPPSETVHICGGCGFISDTTDKHDCPEPYKAFLAATMAKRAEEMGITLEELEAKAKAWIAPPSETKLSEAIENFGMCFARAEDAARETSNAYVQADTNLEAARSSLESLYREQALENERLKENLEQSIKNNGYLLGRYAKSYLLTPEEAQMILDSQPMITSATREKLQRISSKATSEEL